MARDRIEQLRNVQFPTERRGGYDRSAVDGYMRQIADWLETGGEDEARQALVQREMERVGERTGTILSAAQESAERIGAETRAEAERLRSEAEQEAAKARSDADAYAAETRAAADEHARTSGEETEREVERVKAEADEYAQRLTAEADERLRTAEAEAVERTRGIEEEIAALVRKRRQVVANLEQLTAELKLAIEGPGVQDLGLPERVAVAVDQPAAPGPEPVTEPEPAELAEPAEPATAAYELDSEGTEGLPAEADADLDDERELERRRRAYDAAEQPTEDTKLTELL